MTRFSWLDRFVNYNSPFLLVWNSFHFRWISKIRLWSCCLSSNESLFCLFISHWISQILIHGLSNGFFDSTRIQPPNVRDNEYRFDGWKPWESGGGGHSLRRPSPTTSIIPIFSKNENLELCDGLGRWQGDKSIWECDKSVLRQVGKMFLFFGLFLLKNIPLRLSLMRAAGLCIQFAVSGIQQRTPLNSFFYRMKNLRTYYDLNFLGLRCRGPIWGGDFSLYVLV